MRIKHRLAAVGATLALVLGVSLGASSPASASTTVAGSLSCVTGRAVEGVWVAANSSSSGWATLNVASGSSSTVSWHFTLNNAGSYSIHVGCGGSPQTWSSTSYSGTTSGNLPDQICYDTRYEVPVSLQYRCQ